MVGGDQFLAGGHVDPVEAWPGDRRARDPHVDLARPGLAQHRDDLPGRGAAHDRVIDDDQPLAVDDLAQRVELELDAALAQLLVGLDEAAAHVAVAHDRLGVRDAGCERVADGRRCPGVRQADHHVRLDRRLVGELDAHGAALLPDVAAVEQAVRDARSRCARTRTSARRTASAPAGSRRRSRSGGRLRRAAPRARGSRRSDRARTSRRRRSSRPRACRSPAGVRRGRRGTRPARPPRARRPRTRRRGVR